MAEWFKKKKKDLTICCLQKIHSSFKETHRLKLKKWKKIFHASGNQKRAGVATLISEKTDFNSKAVTRDKGGHCMIKGQLIKRI